MTEQVGDLIDKLTIINVKIWDATQKAVMISTWEGISIYQLAVIQVHRNLNRYSV